MSKMIISNFYCTQCGKKNFDVWRKIGREREPGHLKKLYCLNCKKETNCCEIKERGNKYSFLDFQIEYEYGNFNEEGNRIEPNYKKFKQLVRENKIEKQKSLDSMWNSWSR